MAMESTSTTIKRWLRFAAPVLIIGAVGLIYGQVPGHAFINFDDPVYITENPQVLRGLTWEGVKWAFGTGLTGMWQPLTWISLMANVEYLGPGAKGFHLVNVTLHAANALVIYAILLAATAAIGRSLLVALLFTMHPLNVESVAWASQRKSTLSLFLGLLAIWMWVRYLRENSRWTYVLAWFAFLLGLLAKPMLVPLPLLLWLLNYWPVSRAGCSSRQKFMELVPFGVLALVFAWICFHPLGSTDVAQDGAKMTWANTLNVPAYVMAYVVKLVWPHELAVLYPRPDAWMGSVTWLSLAALLGIGWLAWRSRKGDHWRFGYAWFLGALLPVSGLVIIGPHAVADRYFYLPGIGLFIALVWGMPWRAPWIAGAVAALTMGGALAYAQVGLWRDSATLWTYAAKVTPESPTELVNLGAGLIEAGRDQEAVIVLLRARQLAPREYRAGLNLAEILDRHGEKARALAMLDETVQLAPRDARIHSLRGSVLQDLGRWEEARIALLHAINLKPDYAEPWVNLGVLYAARRDWAAAIRAFEQAVAIQPSLASASRNLALARQDLLQEQAKAPQE